MSPAVGSLVPQGGGGGGGMGRELGIHCLHMHLTKVSNHVELCGCDIQNSVDVCNDTHMTYY